MAKVKCFYDKDVTFGLTTDQTFYSYPVEVDEKTLEWVTALRDLIQAEGIARQTIAMPTGAQELADMLETRLGELMKIRKRKVNVSSKDTKSTDE